MCINTGATRTQDVAIAWLWVVVMVVAVVAAQVFDAYFAARPDFASKAQQVHFYFDGQLLVGGRTAISLDMETEVENLVDAKLLA